MSTKPYRDLAHFKAFHLLIIAFLWAYIFINVMNAFYSKYANSYPTKIFPLN